MGATVFCVNATKIYQFKARDSEIKKHPLYLGNMSEDFSANNMKKKKTGVNRCVLIIELLILVILSIFINI